MKGAPALASPLACLYQHNNPIFTVLQEVNSKWGKSLLIGQYALQEDDMAQKFKPRTNTQRKAAGQRCKASDSSSNKGQHDPDGSHASLARQQSKVTPLDERLGALA